MTPACWAGPTEPYEGTPAFVFRCATRTRGNPPLVLPFQRAEVLELLRLVRKAGRNGTVRPCDRCLRGLFPGQIDGILLVEASLVETWPVGFPVTVEASRSGLRVVDDTTEVLGGPIIAPDVLAGAALLFAEPDEVEELFQVVATVNPARALDIAERGIHAHNLPPSRSCLRDITPFLAPDDLLPLLRAQPLRRRAIEVVPRAARLAPRWRRRVTADAGSPQPPAYWQLIE